MDTVPDGRGQDDNPGNAQPRPDTHPLNSLYKHSRERTRPLFRTLVMITSDNHVTMGTTAIARGGGKGAWSWVINHSHANPHTCI